MKLFGQWGFVALTLVCITAIRGEPFFPVGVGAPATAHEMPGTEPGKPHPPTTTHSDHHSQLEIPTGQPLPTVNLVVRPDAMQGWNLEVKVTNFRFAPERINTKSLTTEGHAHLYIDGKKITRLYGPWFYLPTLEPGQHQITVTLNTNGHEALAYKGQVISATTLIQVPTTRP
jgi:hypothetical protein